MTTRIPLPAHCQTALKEWSGICQALASGRQSLLFRKGGIAEDAGQFVPEHRIFWLYPTHLHETQQGLRQRRPLLDEPALIEPGVVPISVLAEAVAVCYIDRWENLADLDDLHVWSAETLQRRFSYRTPGLWALGVRIYCRQTPWLVPATSAHAGCKSWVRLEEALGTGGAEPVLAEHELECRLKRLHAAVQDTDVRGAAGGAPRVG